MKPLAIGVLLLTTSFLFAEDYDKGCDSYYCSKYYWDNGLHRFDPYTIHWPLHHTGEIYKDIHDGGNHHIYIVYYDHYYKKHTAKLKDFRKMPYCPDPYFLKEGIPMEYGFECEEGYTAKPKWVDAKCSMIGKSHEDFQVYVDGPGCSKIIREWTLIDWCKYEPNKGADNNDDDYVLVYDMTIHKAYFAYNHHYGVKHDGYYKFRQVIKILDHTEPYLEDCDDIIYDLKGDCSGYVKLKNRVIDEGLCYGQNMEVKLEVYDHYGNFIHQEWLKSKNEDEFWISAGYLHPGKYHLKWTVLDGCKNKSQCTQYLEVVDSSQPSLLCIQNISSSISDEYGMTIWAEDFVLKATDPCGYDDYLTFSFEEDRNIPSLSFDCSDDFGFHDLTVYVTAANGAKNSCHVELFLSDHFACSDDMQIAGLIINRDREPIPGVEIDIMQSDNLVASSVSDQLGRYVVTGIPTSKSIEYITPHVYENPKEGLNAYDLIRLLRHITGTERFKDVLEYAAADVNENGVVDMNDYWDLATVIFELPHRAVRIPSWKFIDAKLYNAGIVRASQLTAPIPVRTFRHRYDIIGLKNGDLDFSWSARKKAKKRSGARVAEALYHHRLLTVKMPDLEGIEALEITVDKNLLDRSLPVESPLYDEDVAISSVSAEHITFMLMTGFDNSIKPGDDLLILPLVELEREKDITIKAYTNTAGVSETIDLYLDLTEKITIHDHEIAVFPNPFENHLVIYGSKELKGNAKVNIYALDGRMIYSERVAENVLANGHLVLLESSYGPGIYLLEVDGSKGRKTVRLVRQ